MENIATIAIACILYIAVMLIIFEGTEDYVPEWPANQFPWMVIIIRAFFAAAWPIAIPIGLVVAWPQAVKLIREHIEKSKVD